MKRIAIFVSGNGSNLQAIIDAVKKKKIKAEIGLVFSNKRKAYALKRAEEAGVKTLFLNRKNYTNPQSFERDIVIQLKQEKIDYLILAGYMKILSPFFIKTYPKKIINIHPSLLPSFKGVRAIKDTMTYGVKVAGITVHFVDEKMDHGPIIMQQGFMIKDGETLEGLESKIHDLEHKIFPKVVALLVDGRLKVTGRKVTILEKENKH
ncbi:phosphoribosylglycinamide formyltransferase [Candidatus Omnitrophota bacterium]